MIASRAIAVRAGAAGKDYVPPRCPENRACSDRWVVFYRPTRAAGPYRREEAAA